MWSWQDADAERVMGAQPAAVRYEGSDLSWLSAPQQLRAWSQPCANAAQMYSSAPFCVPELNVLSELIWDLLDSALKNNTQSNRYQEGDNLWLQNECESGEMSVMC